MGGFWPSASPPPRLPSGRAAHTCRARPPTFTSGAHQLIAMLMASRTALTQHQRRVWLSYNFIPLQSVISAAVNIGYRRLSPGLLITVRQRFHTGASLLKMHACSFETAVPGAGEGPRVCFLLSSPADLTGMSWI